MSGSIPESFIEDLQSSADIVQILSNYVELKKRGTEFVGLCPFHSEKTPSFSVNPNKQLYYCFGCGKSGNVITFLMEYSSLDFIQAIETLAAQMGMTVPRTQTQISPHQAEYALMERVAEAYYQQMRQSDVAIQYLKQRGLTGEIAKRFRLGYAPAGYRFLDSKFGLEHARDLIHLGLVSEPNPTRRYDRFHSRVIFPIRNIRGNVIAFGGRLLTPKQTNAPKYLNSPETILFNKKQELFGLYEARAASRRPKTVLIVEGYMDVVMLHQHGLTNTVACLGTAISDEHIKKAFTFCPKLIFCFDGDQAGKKAAMRGMEIALTQIQDGREVLFYFLPEGEDPDSMIRRIGKTQFETNLEQAQSLSQVLINALQVGLDLNVLENRAEMVSRAIPYLKRIPNGLFRSMLQAEIAKIAGIEFELEGNLPRVKPYQIEPERQTQSEFKPQTQTSSRNERTRYRSVVSNSQRAFSQSAAKSQRQTTSSGLPLGFKALQYLHHDVSLARRDTVSLSVLANSNDANLQLLTNLIEELRRENYETLEQLVDVWQNDEFRPLLANFLRTIQRGYSGQRGQSLQNETLFEKIDHQREWDAMMIYFKSVHQRRQQEQTIELLAKKPLATLTPDERELLRGGLRSISTGGDHDKTQEEV